MSPKILEDILQTKQVIALKEESEESVDTSKLFVESIPEGAVLVDCRDEEDYQEEHLKGAINIEYIDLLALPDDHLDKKKTYVIYCPAGMKSTVLAEKLQSQGYQAHSLRGGYEAHKNFK